MFKRFIKNTMCSFLTLLLMSVIFTVVGILAIESLKSFSVIVVMIVIFCALLFLGYVIGGRLHYKESISFVSIILLPILMSVVLYALCMIAIPVVSIMIQYPAVIWFEPLKISSYDNAVMFYVVDFLHYFITSLSLFIGAYKKNKV